MEINHDTAVGHARALARNFRTAHPEASDQSTADYVATHMVEFVKRARNAHDLPTDYGSWYADTIVNLY